MLTVTWARVPEPALGRSHYRFSACFIPSSPPTAREAGTPVTPELMRKPEAEEHT